MSAPHSIEFQFQGVSQDALADALAELLSDVLPDWERHTTQKMVTPDPSRRTDPVAVASLIVSVPAALQASWDLVQRMRHKPKFDQFIQRTREMLAETPGSRATILLPNGTVIGLEHLKSEDLLDVISELARQADS